MQISVTQARKTLAALVTRVQDPQEVVVLTRRGEPLAALVSMKDLDRIWDVTQFEEYGVWWHPLHRVKTRLSNLGGPVTYGRDGEMINRREAARQVQEVQMTRAMERGLLRAANLSPIPGGEIGEGYTLRELARMWLRERVWRRLGRIGRAKLSLAEVRR